MLGVGYYGWNKGDGMHDGCAYIYSVFSQNIIPSFVIRSPSFVITWDSRKDGRRGYRRL